jgi:hypothetical protein
VPGEALRALARAVASAALRPTLAGALDDVAEAARVVSSADLALIRVPAGEDLEAVAVTGPSALAAELDGTHLPASDAPLSTLADLAHAPRGIRRAAAWAGARSVLVIPSGMSDSAGTLSCTAPGRRSTSGSPRAAGGQAASSCAPSASEAGAAQLLVRPRSSSPETHSPPRSARGPPPRSFACREQRRRSGRLVWNAPRAT